MGYCSAAEMARRWGVTPQGVAELITRGLVPGAKQQGRMWKIPENTPNPMAGYIFTVKAAKIWDMDRYKLAALCKNGEIPDAIELYHRWYVPVDAVIPATAKNEHPKPKPGFEWYWIMAKKWGVDGKLVEDFLRAGRVPGAVCEEGVWMIPAKSEKPHDIELFWPLEKIAKIWGIPAEQIRGLCQRGRIVCAEKIGRHWYVPKEANFPMV